MSAAHAPRPTAAVIVPFAGSEQARARVIETLSKLRLREGDALIVADNRSGGIAPRAPGGPVRVLPAAGLRAPGFARNRAVAATSGEWLVFLDADTIAPPDLLERYFEPRPDPATAVLAGGILDRPGGTGAAARHSARRRQMNQANTLTRAGRGYAQTANCAVRRRALVAVGGFDETARAGEDADLCFRLADAGWSLEERPLAAVEHVTRGSLAGLARQLLDHGRGAAWLERRYPGEFPAPSARELGGRLARATREALGGLRRGNVADAEAGLVELISAAAFALGRRLPNEPRRG